jgi:hypothetical protein
VLKEADSDLAEGEEKALSVHERLAHGQSIGDGLRIVSYCTRCRPVPSLGPLALEDLSDQEEPATATTSRAAGPGSIPSQDHPTAKVK